MDTDTNLTLKDHYAILEERMHYLKSWHKANRRLLRRMRQNYRIAPVTLISSPIVKH